MEFEWDPEKADSNLLKHVVTFSVAARVFDDIDVLIRIDPRPHGELRWRAIGLVDDLILLVVYTIRGTDSCRIISARRANRRERKDYTLQARH
jgi:uncharacterized protein